MIVDGDSASRPPPPAEHVASMGPSMIVEGVGLDGAVKARDRVVDAPFLVAALCVRQEIHDVMAAGRHGVGSGGFQARAS